VSAIMRTISSIRATVTGGHRVDAPQSDPLGNYGSRVDGGASRMELGPNIHEHVRLDDTRFWLAAIADSSDNAIIAKDLDDLVKSWNRAAETMFGFTAREMIGHSITKIIPADRIDEDASIVKRIGRSLNTLHFETERQSKDGTIIPVALTVSPIRDDNGRLIGVSKTVQNPTETQRVQRDLQRREALLRSILETVPDAAIVIDKQGFIHSFSAAAIRLFGYRSEEIMGRKVDILLPSSDWNQHNRSPEGYSATGERRVVGFGQRKDGSGFPMDLVIGEIDLPGTRLLAIFVHDLTEQSECERGLRAANTELEHLARHLAMTRDASDRSNFAKSSFLVDLSLDLRAPLKGILGDADLLRIDSELSAAQSQRVDAIEGAAKQLLQMVTSVQDLSEIEAEQVELKAVELDVLAVATACFSLVRPAAEAKRLALSIAVTPGTRQDVVTDPTRLRQILLNLLGNAVRLTSDGSIALRLRPVADGSFLRIEVADTGPGIPANERRHLFRDLERVDPEATRGVEGAGLGLALTARLATLLGGCLGHHDNPGGGSVSWLELPFGAAPRQETGPVDAAPSAPHAALHILVVDDIAMNRDIAGSFLRAAGHKVTCVEGGAEAIAIVEQTDFDVVLMDVRMPEMDGLEATRRIRAIAGVRGQVPIVALTAQAFSEQVAECRKAGMSLHLPKPFDPDSLLAAVLRAVALDQPRDEIVTPGKREPAPVIPVIGSDLMVCNSAAFERTAFYLPPEAVASYLQAIIERGEALLRGLQEPDALVQNGDELADAAHTIAGSAGMFGFERLTTMGRRFERGVHAGAADLQALTHGLHAALEATLEVLRDRMRISAEA
jgi:PAS domain S-box-containing protein